MLNRIGGDAGSGCTGRTGSRRPRAIEAVCVAAAVVGLTVAQLFRQSGVHSWDTVWAEDGKYFFNGTNHLGDLFHQQAGYLQLTGRIFGLGGARGPDRRRRDLLHAGGAALTSLMAAAVWYFSESLVTSRVLRAVLALQVVLLPALLLEQVANGVNAMWAVVYVLWWALVYRPRHTVGVVGAALVVVLAACSNSLALVFLPLAAVLAWRRPGRYRIVAGAYAVGCLVQGVVILTSPATETAPHRVVDFPGIFSIRVLASMVVGEQWVGDAWSALGWGLAGGGRRRHRAGCSDWRRRGRGEARVLGIVAVAYAVLLYFAELWVRGSLGMRIGSDYHSFGARYSSLSIWLTTAGLVLLVSSVARARVVRAAVAVLVAWFVVTSIGGFRGATPRSPGPGWKTSVVQARAAVRGCRPGATRGRAVPVRHHALVRRAELSDAGSGWCGDHHAQCAADALPCARNDCRARPHRVGVRAQGTSSAVRPRRRSRSTSRWRTSATSTWGTRAR